MRISIVSDTFAPDLNGVAMVDVDGSLKVVVVGDGPLREEVESAHPEAIFAGVKRGEELAEHYASADLFPFASTSETYGNVVVEALASGLQVIAFDYAAPAKFIRDGENGRLSPLGDAEGFVKRCVLAVGTAFDQGIRESAVASASDESWERVVEIFESKLEEIVSEHEPRGPLPLDLELKVPWAKGAEIEEE